MYFHLWKPVLRKLRLRPSPSTHNPFFDVVAFFRYQASRQVVAFPFPSDRDMEGGRYVFNPSSLSPAETPLAYEESMMQSMYVTLQVAPTQVSTPDTAPGKQHIASHRRCSRHLKGASELAADQQVDTEPAHPVIPLPCQTEGVGHGHTYPPSCPGIPGYLDALGGPLN